MIDVHVPGRAEDRPPWKRVAVIAAVGFLVGVAWPRLAGVRLGPSLPEVSSASSSASASPTQAPSIAAAPSGAASGASALVPAASGAAPASVTASMGPSISVASGAVQSCKTPDGDVLKDGDCGKLPGLDGIVLPRLRKLSECADAADASGKMQLIVHLDFARGWLSVDLGRGQVVASEDALLACAKANLAGVTIGSIAHDNPRYSVSYALTFGPNGRPASASVPSSARSAGEPTDATAQVVWEVAIVRDAPKTGKVIARLPRGTAVRLATVKDGWYPVQYGEGFAGTGWLYRGAIGR